MLRRRSQRRSEATSRRPPRRLPGAESLERRALLSGGGGLDVSFGGGDGIVTRGLTTAEGAFAFDTALQADGKIVAVGNTGENLFVARYTADGALDRSFGAGGGIVPFDFPNSVSQTARRVVVQPDQKILVAGDDWYGPALARFNPDGSVDATFGIGGRATSSFGSRDTSALALQQDGRILFGGRLRVTEEPNRGSYDFFVQRLTPDGNPDATFDRDSAITFDINQGDDLVTGLAEVAGGKVVVAGNTGLARFNPDGSLDTTFGGGDGVVGGGVADPTFHADAGVVVLPDLGSAVLTVRAVLEDHGGQSVLLADAPFVEGAVAAAVAANGGAGIEGVLAAAEGAGARFGGAGHAATGATPAAEVPTGRPVLGTLAATVTLRNPLGLHARPAAVVARTAAGFDAQVTVNGVNAASVLELMRLGATGGQELAVEARGAQARQALDAVVAEVEGGFGEV